jgi:hypothetical protein
VFSEIELAMCNSRPRRVSELMKHRKPIITDNTSQPAYFSLPAYYLNLGWPGSQRREDAPGRAAGDSGAGVKGVKDHRPYARTTRCREARGQRAPVQG